MRTSKYDIFGIKPIYLPIHATVLFNDIKFVLQFLNICHYVQQNYVTVKIIVLVLKTSLVSKVLCDEKAVFNSSSTSTQCGLLHSISHMSGCNCSGSATPCLHDSLPTNHSTATHTISPVVVSYPSARGTSWLPSNHSLTTHMGIPVVIFPSRVCNLCVVYC